MKRAAGIFVFAASAAALAGCASGGSDVDSESHFQCGEDGDCKYAQGRSICVSGRCEVPGIRQTVLDEVSGPAVDCTTEWPATTLRFDTAGKDSYQVSEPVLRGPRLNRNGTVIVGFTRLRSSGVKGHLIRWTGDTVSRFEQTVEQPEVPRSVSCDGMTIVGTAGASAYRWSATDGFALLPSPGGLGWPHSTLPMALSPDGSTAWGLYRSASIPVVFTAIRWQDGLAERLFTLDEAAEPAPGWSADGSTFIGSTDEGLFIQNAGTAPNVLETPPTVHGALISAVSFDGKIVAGMGHGTGTEGHAHLWSSENQLEHLPDGTTVFGVTPGGIAVGIIPGHDPQGDHDFVWDRKHGARHLRDVLAIHGLQLPSNTIIDQSTDISVDGRVITGVMVGDEGLQIFRAIVPAGAFD